MTLLPANVYEAVADVSFANGEAATPLWQRIPEQILYIGVVLWVARSADSTPVRRALASLRRTPIEPKATAPKATAPKAAELKATEPKSAESKKSETVNY